jgi:3-hydroxyacyl-[acyl-carrier protein] dehydratase/trans-2-decenoyl-[acyl-carrier protein] isomerase
MLYSDFKSKTSLSKLELLSISKGNLVDDPPAAGIARLPSPPLLMFDRVIKIESATRNGRIIAEQDIIPDAWYFQSHFVGDPVQPGCLGVDALWQLLGLYCSFLGAVGAGRALGCKEVEFSGQIRPFDKQITYDLEVHRYTTLDGGGGVAIGSGRVFVDGEHIYSVRHLKVGVFPDIRYDDYPNPDSPHARGGIRGYD